MTPLSDKAKNIINKWRNRHKHIYYPVAHTGGGSFCRCGKATFPDGWGIDYLRRHL